MRLHLGCGERYLEGYINIDFPLSEHTVQSRSAADRHADITTLRYRGGEVDEVRLHHVFEHFTRPVACALLASWHSWLRADGILHIEVPDFQKTARAMLGRFMPFKRQALAERHLFGSHEAQWAVHCDGYTPNTLTVMVQSYGFKAVKVEKNSWMNTHNFELVARKRRERLTRADFSEITRAFLTNYLVDESDGELRLLRTWMNIYDEQVQKGWAYDD
jgi:predicted SAM-dependent methyltransferase